MNCELKKTQNERVMTDNQEDSVGRPKKRRESAILRVTVSKAMKDKIQQMANQEELDISDALRPLVNAYGRGELAMKPVWTNKQ